MAATACPQGLLTTLVVVLQWKSRGKKPPVGVEMNVLTTTGLGLMGYNCPL